MSLIINPKWAERVKEDIRTGKKIDETIKFNKSAQWLITVLSNFNVPFKVYNLGAGVKRITTDTDVCPCCKRSIEK